MRDCGILEHAPFLLFRPDSRRRTLVLLGLAPSSLGLIFLVFLFWVPSLRMVYLSLPPHLPPRFVYYFGFRRVSFSDMFLFFRFIFASVSTCFYLVLFMRVRGHTSTCCVFFFFTSLTFIAEGVDRIGRSGNGVETTAVACVKAFARCSELPRTCHASR